MMRLISALVVSACAGCAAPSLQVAQSAAVKPATADQVSACAYVDDVVGTSAWYGAFATQGAENARQELLGKAERLGATHVVWRDPAVAYGGTSVSAKAYRCPSK